MNLTKLLFILPVAAGLCSAETWNAKLLDASCADKNATTATSGSKVAKKSHESLARTCAPTNATTAFAIETRAGHVYKLDSVSNANVASKFQSGGFKADNDGDVHATVNGTLQGDTVKVNSITGKAEHEKKKS